MDKVGSVGKKRKSTSTEKKAVGSETSPAKFCALVTGLRDGDVLVGRLSTNRRTLIRVAFDDGAGVPPHPSYVERSFADETSTRETLRQLRSLPFFATMESDEARQEWLQRESRVFEPAAAKHRLFTFESVPGLRLQFLHMGDGENNLFTNGTLLSDEQITTLLSFTEPVSYQREILALAPFLTKDGNGEKGVLVTCVDQWIPVAMARIDNSFCGWAVCAENGTLTKVLDGRVRLVSLNEADSGEKETNIALLLPPSGSVALPQRFASTDAQRQLIERLLHLHFGSVSLDSNLSKACTLLADLSAGALKSLVQKLIRYQPLRVRLPTRIVPPEEVEASQLLAAAVCYLGIHPGSFVPDQQSFQSGAHSLAKRLLVMLYEDAALDIPLTGPGTRDTPVDISEDESCTSDSSSSSSSSSSSKSSDSSFDSFESPKHLSKKRKALAAESPVPRQLCAANPLPSISDAVSLAAGALWGQLDSTWRPTEALLLRWVRVAVAAMRDSHFMQVPMAEARGAHASRPFTWSRAVAATEERDTTALAQLVSALLDFMGSFDGDKALLHYCAAAARKGRSVICTPLSGATYTRPAYMPLLHYLDQHVSGNIAYMFDAAGSDPLLFPVDYRAPFDRLFTKIFEHVCGVNPRKCRVIVSADQFEADPFVRHLRLAQQRLYHSMRIGARLIRKPASNAPTTVVANIRLDDAWVSALIGQLEIRSQGIFYAAIDANDIGSNELRLVRKPARGKANEESQETLDEKTRISLLQQAVARLVNYPLAAANPPVDQLRGACVTRSLDAADRAEYTFTLADGSTRTWEELQMAEVRVVERKVQAGPQDVFAAALGTEFESGVPVANLQSLLEGYQISHQALQRAIRWLSVRGERVQVPSITRDAAAAKDALTAHDPAAYRLLLYLSSLCPEALLLRRDSVLVFEVQKPLLLWWLVEKLTALYRTRLAASLCVRSDPRQRFIVPQQTGWQLSKKQIMSRKVPMTHQTDAAVEFRERLDRGQRGWLLWMTVGAGKTLITALALGELADRDQLPPYVIYTAPKESMQSVVDEYKSVGLPVRRVDRVSALVKSPPRPYCVLFVEHDHLRDLTDVLEPIAPEAVVIVDEVHKMLSRTTKRTRVGTALAQMAKYFLALTGTLIVNNDPQTLAQWLSMLLPFDVTLRNIWTAASAITHYEQRIEVETKRIEHRFDMTTVAAYRRLVPPSLGGTAERMSPDDFTRALALCYQAAYQQMAPLILKHLRQPNSRGAMAVVWRAADQLLLRDSILEVAKGELQADDILLLGQEGIRSVNLTDEAVEHHQVHDYRVVIVTPNQSAGYSLSRLNAMFTSVYPSNLATREQLEGRIRRRGQRSPVVLYTVVHGGVLTNILQRYDDARQLRAAYNMLSKSIA